MGEVGKKDSYRYIWLILILLTAVFYYRLILAPGSIFYPSEDIISENMFFENTLFAGLRNSGTIPLWNNFYFSGMPFVGNPVIPLFYPMSLLLPIVPQNLLIGYSIVLHTFLAGLFTYLLGKELGLDSRSAIMPAVAYMFSAVMLGNIIRGGYSILMAISLVPLVFLALERLIKSPGMKGAALLGVACGLQMLTSSIQVFYFTALFGGLYLLIRLVQQWMAERDSRQTAKTVGFYILGIVICVCLAMAYLLPSLEFFRYSGRSGGLSFEGATTFSLPPRQLISLLLPNLFGSAADGTYWGMWDNPWGMFCYVGVITLVLAGIGLLAAKEKPVKAFAGLALISLLFGMGRFTPLYGLFYNLVPGVRLFRNPAEQFYILDLGLALMAGFGMMALMRARQTLGRSVAARRGVKILLAVALISLIGAVAVFSARDKILSLGAELGKQRYAELHPGEQDFESNYLPKIQAAFRHIYDGTLIFSVMLAFGAALIWLRLSKGLDRNIFLCCCVLMLFADLWVFGQPLAGVTGAGRIFTQERSPALISFFQNDTSKYRVLDLPEFIPQELAPNYGIELVNGYDPSILGDYIRLTNHASPASLDSYDLGSFTRLPLGKLQLENITNPGVLDMLNVKYIVSNKAIADARYELMIFRPGYVREGDLDRYKAYSNKSFDLYLYRNTKALPRAYLVGTALSATNHSQALELISSPSFDPHSAAIVEGEVPAWFGNSTISEEAQVTGYSANSIKVDAGIDRPMLLVLSEIWYPGWKAYDNGKEVPIVRADYDLRGVWLDKGLHKLEFRYEPVAVKLGLAVSALALIALAVICTRRSKGQKPGRI